MKNISHFALATLAATLLTACNPQDTRPDVWPEVESRLRTVTAPDEAVEAGPPLRIGNRILFRFRPPAGTERVFLAGNFNGWGQNTNGQVSNMRYAMRPAVSGVWYHWVDHRQSDYAFKYVLDDGAGEQEWVSDPDLGPGNDEGHSLISFPLEPIPEPDSPAPAAGSEPPALRVYPERVWTSPGQTNTLRVLAEKPLPKAGEWRLRIREPLGTLLYETRFPIGQGPQNLPTPPMESEGGYLAEVALMDDGKAVAEGWTVLSVAKSVADDLRYGFFATYAEHEGDYARKAEMLAELHVNAVEYYDYFPAHGTYAPTQTEYVFEPFDVEINALDIRDKIKAGHDHNILSLAYVAAYAASESVYRKYPYPMTNADGIPLVFNGQIMPETRADAEGKQKWFWLMNIGTDSPWRTYIMDQFRLALGDGEDSLLSFDGFEIDTYGDRPEDLFHAPGSADDGQLLRDVLRGFVRETRELTRRIKPYGLVSFNSVNEFGVEGMYDITDFLFMEIWRFYADQLGELVDICYFHRGRENQRVVLKVYPADMDPKNTSFSPSALARLMGACMTGGGSLMVAGEPDEAADRMHGLNSLYYPDHTPLAEGAAEVLRAYNLHDALFFGYTHGRDVHNSTLRVEIPGCTTRAFVSPRHRSLTLRILHTGADGRWSADVNPPAPRVAEELRIRLPDGVVPASLHYASPDRPSLEQPQPLEFSMEDGVLVTQLPELHTLGTLVLTW